MKQNTSHYFPKAGQPAPASTRRQWLQATAAGMLACSTALQAQPAGKGAGAKAAAGAPVATVVQIVDMSADQQDISRDLVVGARAAWQSFNAQGGLKGRPVLHRVLETDGSADSLQAAWQATRKDSSCVALAGCTGNTVAAGVIAQQAQSTADERLAHMAPWLQNADTVLDDASFPIFADHHAQIEHALKSLAVMGVRELGVVYASPAARTASKGELERTSQALKLRLVTLPAGANLTATAQQLPPQAPSILLFMGGTPELAQFMQGMKGRKTQHFVVAMADANLQTLAQLGTLTSTAPVVVTQTVPLVNAGLPVVRAYRDAMVRYYDEPPTPQSLAGFIGARYAITVLQGLDAAPTRQNVLAACQRRNPLDLGGFQVRFDGNKRSGHYVTQSMLSPDGRVVG